jgi:hypothetical protein
MNGFEAIRHVMNNRHVGVSWLTQADQCSLVASRAFKRFVPLIGHDGPFLATPMTTDRSFVPRRWGMFACRISPFEKSRRHWRSAARRVRKLIVYEITQPGTQS